MTIAVENVVGVLVAYQPDDALHARIEAHMQQLSSLIVVHNGADDTPCPVLEAFCNAQSHVQYASHGPNNLGAAQNAGIKAALAQGAQAVLLLDDDSQMQPNMLAQLCAACSPNYGLVAPNIIEPDGQSHTRYVSAGYGGLFRVQRLGANQPRVENAFTLIASGSLIPASTFTQIGLMDASFGIDYIDRDFCLRLLEHGLQTLALADAKLSHQLGQSQSHHCMGAQLRCRHHSASRRYSIFKNRVRCWRRHGLAMPAFVVYDTIAAAYDIVRIAGFETDKKAKLSAAFKGVLHACLNLHLREQSF